jgi:hypothetical protein
MSFYHFYMQNLYCHIPTKTESDAGRDRLLKSALSGAEIGLFIESSAFPEWLLFDDFAVFDGHLYGWNSPCIGQGRRFPSLDRKHTEIVRCVYCTDGSVSVFRRCMKKGTSRNDTYTPVEFYRTYSWTQLSPAEPCTPEEGSVRPNRLRCVLEFSGVTFAFRPNIVYFDDESGPGEPIASLKSKDALLPASLVSALTGDGSCEGIYEVALYVSREHGSCAIVTRHDEKAPPFMVKSEHEAKFYLTL